MKDVTLIVTCFMRLDKMRKCVESIRKYYPDERLLVVDSSGDQPGLAEEIWYKHRAELVVTPYDCGIGAMRLAGIEAATTKYVVILEEDFIFTDETRLEKFREVLERDSSVGWAAGSLDYSSYGRACWACRIDVNENDRNYWVFNIHKPEILLAGEVEYYYADYVYNFLMMRRDIGIYWDPDYRTGMEHADYAIRVKLDGRFRFAVVPDVCAYHDKTNDTKEYERKRQRLESWERFYRKTGFKEGVNVDIGVVYDFKNLKKLTYPEYVFMLLKSQNMSQRDAGGDRQIDRAGQSGG